MPRSHSFILALFALLPLAAPAAPPATAPTTKPAAPAPPPTPAELRRYARLEAEMMSLIQKQDWPAVAEITRRQMAFFPRSPEPYYNLACALARQKKTDEAFAALNQAMDRGYAEPAHMKEDEDLTNLRADPRFDKAIKQAREIELAAPYEKGTEIKGIKSIEAFPEGGFRYRLRIAADAKPDKPAKLIIWLHPAGGSMNKVVEDLSPDLAGRGYALLVVTRKQFMGWREDELDRLLGPTLADVATHKEIDAAKPMLMGFSAGGQAALTAWQKTPDAFSGLILDAAYPIDMTKYAHGQLDIIPLPEGDLAKATPIFALVGQADAGSQIWKAAKPKWLSAGVPLMVHYVEGKGHAWLFDAAHLKQLDDWLDNVSAGKKPSDPRPLPPNAL